MTGQIVVRQPPMSLRHRRQQQQTQQGSGPLSMKKGNKGSRIAEVAGGTAADCAAVCCCCPCGIVNLIVVAVVKLPAGLCRRAIRRSRLRKRAKKDHAMLPPIGPLEVDFSFEAMGLWPPDKSPSAVVSEMEKEMWAKFYGTGFWRSCSRRDAEEEED